MTAVLPARQLGLEPDPFDVCGPLPQGTVVLQASAGTGKTATIANLVTRWVAEGAASLDQIIVVTFGRAATRELRDRVRERLVTVRDGLLDAQSARRSGDEVLALLARPPGAGDTDAEVGRRQARLAGALAGFDGATIVTTHELCSTVLRGLGAAGALDPATRLVESMDDLITEVVHDLYLRQWGTASQVPVSAKDALALGRVAVGDPQAVLLPRDAEPGSTADLRVRLAGAVRTEIARRAARRRVMGFDDLLARLRDVLVDPTSGPGVRASLQRRFPVVLVDEFQDTDPVQWEVLSTAFSGVSTLVLIGDPKQAIYAFRGADVTAYLAAVAQASTLATLARTWRSDAALLAATSALLGGAALGDPQIAVGEVLAARAGPPMLPDDVAPVRLRVLPRAEQEAGGTIKVAAARPRIVADCAAQISALLARGEQLWPRDGSEPRPLSAGDIAVLTPSNARADEVRDALVAAGVPAVRTGADSVFATQAARHWLVLLQALEQPHRQGRVRLLALSPFVGWTPADLDAADDRAVDGLTLSVRQWVRVLEERGVAATYEAVAAGERLAERLLSRPSGERLLTDLRHVAQALHGAAREGSLGLSALLTWLRRRVAEAGEDKQQERSRRLDSDASAVQVLTVHASKGLEFPVVAVPFAWDRHVRDPEVPLLHLPDGRRARDVGGSTGPTWAADVAAALGEDAGESLRLLYVALTRAQARLLLWWAPATTTSTSPLHRLLMTATPAAGVRDQVDVPRDDAAVLATMHARVAAASGGIAVEVIGVEVTGVGGVAVGGVGPEGVERMPAPAAAAAPSTSVGGARVDQPALRAARLDRPLDTTWRRTSYTALTRAAHDAGPRVGSEPEVTATADEPDEQEAPAAPVGAPDGERDPLAALASPLADLPAGAAFGTLVHAVLEELDTGDGTLGDAALRLELHERASWALDRHAVSGVDAQTLTEALLPALRTPLGPQTAQRCLAAFPIRDQLRELEIELPLAGGDSPRAGRTLRDVAGLLRDHLSPEDPLESYAAALEDLAGDAAPPLRGFLTGSIDLVLRVRAEGGDEPRYVIADHKTNRLAMRDEALTIGHYRQAALLPAMVDAHYPLQALVYSTGLHRFLRWRQPGYDPAVHLGGVLYLFVRGMPGPQVSEADGSIPGVFAWQPPAALVTELSDLFAGAAR